jgi:endoglucanase
MIQPKIFIYLLITIFFNSAYLLPQNFIHTEGRNIVDGNGDIIELKGINLGNWLVPEGYMFKFKKTNSPLLIDKVINEMVGPGKAKSFWKEYRDNYYTLDDIKFVKDCGLNSIRVPFNYRLFVLEGPENKWINTGFEMLDRVIKWCEEENIYVILDMHCAPGGQTGDNIDDSFGYPFLMVDEYAQDLITQVWEKIAERYKDNRIVLGYDLMNEPIAHYFEDENLQSRLEPLYRKITAAIRAVDQNHIIILGGARWNTDFSVFSEPFDPNLVYEFHKYWCDTTQTEIQEYVDFRDKYNVPIWMGESGENTYEWISAWRRLMEKNDIGWCFWPLKRLDTDRSLLSITEPEDFDKIIDFAELPRNTFKEIRENRPPIEISYGLLKSYLRNIRFNKCTVNKGYLKALGLEYNSRLGG